MLGHRGAPVPAESQTGVQMTLAGGTRRRPLTFVRGREGFMTDHQITPSPGVMSPEGGTAQSTAQTTSHATRAAARAAMDEAQAKPAPPWFRKKRFALPAAVVLQFGVPQKAQGVFVTVRVSVTNIGYESRSLTATDLFLVDDQGKRFATSSAILTVGGAEKIFLHKVNPGHTVNDAPVLLDLVPGTAIATIELHDSTSSAGVKVKLR